MGRQVTQSRMQSLLIVNFVEKVRQAALHILEAVVIPQIDLLIFKVLHETLCRRTIIRVAFARHADTHLGCLSLLYIGVTGVLYPAVRMMNAAFNRSSLFEGHPE